VRLKKSFVSAPVLHHFDPEREIMIKTDSSNLVVIGVLSQYDDDSILHPWPISHESIAQPGSTIRSMIKNVL
jgi:hypothetical protein